MTLPDFPPTSEMSPPPRMLGGLNPDQRKAVTAPGSALVLAGAGSGKTRVLTTRIAWLIQTAQVSPMGLLAVTFTNKAAKEMLARLSAMLPINTRGMWVGTFHGLCNRLLRAHHREAGLPQLFQILDSADQLAAIKRLMKTLNVDSDKYEPRKVQAFINQNKEAGLRADRVEAWDPYSRRLVELFAEYDAQCQREGVADFAELLLRSYELLNRNALLREHYQTRFCHILVDEFQDTSKLQYAWLKLLGGPETAFFAVGDDDQSIYAFRGANVGNMGVFMRDLGLTEPIKLTRNYRSHSTILDAANAVIARNEDRLGKNLWTDAGAGEPIRHYQAMDDREEAGFVVEAIRDLRRDGLDYSDIAVLYRSNAQSRAIEHALFTAGLPYRVYGGQRFFERAEIKHALAYLRLIANPEDDNAFLRVVNFPTRGIGARSLETLDGAARQRGVTLWRAACAAAGKDTGRAAEGRKRGHAEQVSDPVGGGGDRAGGGGRFADGRAPEGTPLPARGLPGFVALIEGMRAETASLPLPEVAAIVVERSGLLAHYQTEKDGESRIENLNELTNAAAAFAGESDDSSLTAFLAHAALEAGEHEAGASADAVQLMTVHAAKGLEFHTVFITGLEEGLFPHENALNEAGGLEEERRLMYVAITRARRRLFLTHAAQRLLHGQPRYGLPSRFLEEIPAALVHSLNLRTPPTSATPATRSVTAHTPPASRALSYKIGARVSHPRYGEGVVSGYQGQGAESEIGVAFPGIGEKWFILDYVKLTAC